MSIFGFQSWYVEHQTLPVSSLLNALQGTNLEGIEV